MNPVGNPLANSSTELMLEVIDGLKSAGVKTTDMFVFERYRDEFIDAGMHEGVPDGIAWGGLTYGNDPSQLEISWPDGDEVSGYDPDEYVSMNLVHPSHDPKDERRLSLAPRDADHQAGEQGGPAAGAQGPRLGRDHRRPEEHEPRPGQQRRPIAQLGRGERLQPVHPRGRQPPDHPQEVRPADHGRHRRRLPGRPLRPAKDPHWTWENNALLLATDPVAMDRIEWDIIDAKRRRWAWLPSAPSASSAHDADAKGSTCGSPSTSSSAATSASANPAASRSTTGSSTWPDRPARS